MPRRPVVTLVLLLLTAISLSAADLPKWDDDSAVTVTPYPQRFAPQLESANLVVQVFHPIDARTDVRWNVTVTQGSGAVVRRFNARQTFWPGEALLFSTAWNGRDELGRTLPAGTYEVVADVELRAVGERTRFADDGDNGEEIQPRVQVIRQRAAHTLIIDTQQRHRLAAPQSQTPHDPGNPYTYYYGTLHNQTSYSDGGHPNDANCASSTVHGGSDFNPAQAYSYARNTARLDFMGITDHNHQFNDACSGCTAAQIVQRYHDGLNAAAAATVDGSFVGIYGMEWGYISNSSFPNEGHVGVFESPKLFGWEPASTCTVGVDCYFEVYTNQSAATYPTMYTKALQNPSAWGAFGQFMHPSDGTKSAVGQGVDYNSLQYTTDGDDFIHTAAVISGPATDFSTATVDTGALYAGEPVNGPSYAAYTSTDMYNRILGAGFHIAPAADPDVHCSNYGTSTRDRTVILASSLTKAALFDAIHNRRVYATSDSNVQLVYNMVAGGTTYWMGAGGIRTSGPVSTTGAVTLHVSVWDPDVNEFASSIKIKEPVPGNTNGADTLIASSTASPFDYTFTPPAGKHCYYVYVTMNSGDRIFSAPIWINESTTPDTTPPTTSITAPASGATVSGTTTVTASAADNVGVTKVEFYLDNVLQSTATTSPYQWAWNTGTSANGSHTLTSKAYDAANNTGTSAGVTVTVSNASDYSLSISPASATVTAGASASYTVNVTRTNFTGAVTMSISGLPSGATATFTPNPATGNSSALSIATTATTPPGSYVFTVTGVSGTLTHTATATLVVQAPGTGDFTLSATPASRTITAGTSTTYTVTITRTGGFTGAVAFTVSGLGTGATGSFNPSSTTGTSTTLTITTTSSAATGSRVLTITGTGGGLTRTTTVTLVVNSCNGNC